MRFSVFFQPIGRVSINLTGEVMDCRNLTPGEYDLYTQERIKGNSVVNEVTGCWIWKGSKGPGGYGSIRYYGKTKTPHKVSYIVFNGPVPDGMIVRHMCHDKACVNQMQ